MTFTKNTLLLLQTKIVLRATLAWHCICSMHMIVTLALPHDPRYQSTHLQPQDQPVDVTDN